VTVEEGTALRALVDRLTWRACKPDYALKVGRHEYVVRGKTIDDADWLTLTEAVKRHGVRERYLRTKQVGRYLKLADFRYWHIQVILNRASLEEGTHEPVEEKPLKPRPPKCS
jgi:hypothetical protein